MCVCVCVCDEYLHSVAYVFDDVSNIIQKNYHWNEISCDHTKKYKLCPSPPPPPPQKTKQNKNWNKTPLESTVK